MPKCSKHPFTNTMQHININENIIAFYILFTTLHASIVLHACWDMRNYTLLGDVDNLQGI